PGCGPRAVAEREPRAVTFSSVALGLVLLLGAATGLFFFAGMQSADNAAWALEVCGRAENFCRHPEWTVAAAAVMTVVYLAVEGMELGDGACQIGPRLESERSPQAGRVRYPPTGTVVIRRPAPPRGAPAAWVPSFRSRRIPSGRCSRPLPDPRSAAPNSWADFSRVRTIPRNSASTASGNSGS